MAGRFNHLEHRKRGSTMENQSDRTIPIAANFAVEPVEESLRFWGQELEIPFKIDFAAYEQIFQLLLRISYRMETGYNPI